LESLKAQVVERRSGLSATMVDEGTWWGRISRSKTVVQPGMRKIISKACGAFPSDQQPQ
jgi:hypothetical protein